jgi:hypothetical protein
MHLSCSQAEGARKSRGTFLVVKGPAALRLTVQPCDENDDYFLSFSK